MITKLKSLSGADADFLFDKKEFYEMIKPVRNREKLLGKVDYLMTEKKRKIRQFSRSFYVAEDIKKDEINTETNVRSIRLRYGLDPKHLKEILGKQVVIESEKVRL